MKTFKYTLAAFLAASSIALAIPLTVEAAPMGDGMAGCRGSQGMHGPREGLPRMMKKLKLTPEQEAKISDLRKQDAELIGAQLKVMDDSRTQLHELQKSDTYDEAKIKALTEQGAQAMASMGQLRARQHYQMMQILSPEQRQEFDAQRERMMKRWEEKRQGRPAS
ncbi:Spy/CpxP family protein refolding chaperone [Candidatus Accumulibacter sp. ACC003]|uniref:Spy/CpxP family protein refolding chaperone n=1 Tax=Candidatus Accumulibacter sp. ACC003 TaxID=2823334 RepID=UPI0025C24337|nr:Spy/CpxP family protein refolding chaperone [Candidatus Accumulibacter sp. ACC003]